MSNEVPRLTITQLQLKVLQKLFTPLSPVRRAADQSNLRDEFNAIPTVTPSSSHLSKDLAVAEGNLPFKFDIECILDTPDTREEFLLVEGENPEEKNHEIPSWGKTWKLMLEPPLLNEEDKDGSKASRSLPVQQSVEETWATWEMEPEHEHKADYDEFFEHSVRTENLKQMAEKTPEHLQQWFEKEKFKSLDTVCRVSVSKMSFRIPDPSWESCKQPLSRGIYGEVDADGMNTSKLLQTWPLHRSSEKRLVWIPIDVKHTKAFILKTESKFPCDPEAVTMFLASPNPPQFRGETTKTAMSKIAVPEITDFGRIETMTCNTGNGGPSLESLVTRKRRRALENTEWSGSLQSEKKLAQAREAPSVDDMLSAYLDSRSANLVVAKQSAHFQGLITIAPAREQLSRRTTTLVAELDEKLMEDTFLSATAIWAPLPRVTAKVVASIQLPKGLEARLREKLPGLEVITRDYNQHNTAVRAPHARSNRMDVSELKFPVAGEADITVTPATGIVVVPEISLYRRDRQGNSCLEMHVAEVSSRYTFLVVLIWEDRRVGGMPLAMIRSRTRALAKFIFFANSLPNKVAVKHIIGGTDALTGWVAGHLAYFTAMPGATNHQDELLENETWGEIFFRRLGLNVFDAHVLLHRIYQIHNSKTLRQRSHGETKNDMSSLLARYLIGTKHVLYPSDSMEMVEGIPGYQPSLKRIAAVITAVWPNLI
jgi:hypothetical protein